MEKTRKHIFSRALLCLLLVGMSIFHSHDLIFSQYNFVERTLTSPVIDTLTSQHRSGGIHIDSLDLAYYDHYPTLFNVGRAYLPFFQPLKSWGSYRHFFIDERPVYRAKHHFTALPYTGFFYSFGSGGEQILDLRYTQNIGQNTNVSFRYHRSIADPKSAGFLFRGIESKTNDLSLNVHYHKKRLNSFFSTYYGFDNFQENFGIAPNGPSVDSFPLVQIPVNNTNANVRLRRMQFNWRNEFELKNSPSRNVFWISNLGLHNFQRRYKDSTDAAFQIWIYDSSKTNDLWEEPHLLVENGLQLKLGYWKVYGGFHVDYFSYFNSTTRKNRTDGILTGSMNMQKKNLVWNNHVRYIAFGTSGEYHVSSILHIKLNEKLKTGYEILHERYFPEFFQIQFSGNHFAYNFIGQNILPSTRTFVEPFVKLGKKQIIQLSMSYLQVKNLYRFQGSTWNFGGNQDVLSAALCWELQHGIFKWNGKTQFFMGNKSSFFAPDYLMSTRLFADGALFAAKKLKVAAGIGAQFFAGYQTMRFVPELGVYDQLLNPSSLPQQNLLLNLFVNLQMDRFRFFLAANHINTLFETRLGGIVSGYPIRPFFMRIGLSWDFVN
jgi:hypothetical protein